ncbi:MAG TPA: ABC transporter ATP-binding protein [Roseiflexaceae bacterium]|nr:ABC transporter ATP-binding protein [Roseiflexaceae bacterium]
MQMLFARFGRSYGREFWALRDVSFSIERGESVGIIGRNGSGKSTLLQMIAGTLAPTTGEISVKGRVAALLELGSGFNPEFTGRENVFLNGAILGIERAEMETHFDEIALFAEIGDFMDQPVKTYSSGMVVRLAFAVQAIVQKEILIVDEALAVGDEAFQRKCMRKLEEFRAEGGTVLLVTHSTQAIVRQCSRAIWIHEGRVRADGPSKIVSEIYQRFVHGGAEEQQAMLQLMNEQPMSATALLAQLRAQRNVTRGVPLSSTVSYSEAGYDASVPQTQEMSYGNGQAIIMDAAMYDAATKARVNLITSGSRCLWRYQVRFYETAWGVNFGMMIKTIEGIEIVAVNTELQGLRFDVIPAGRTVDVEIELKLNLAPGVYFLNSGVTGETASATAEAGFLHRRLDICAIRVIAEPESGFGIAYVEPKMRVRDV